MLRDLRENVSIESKRHLQLTSVTAITTEGVSRFRAPRLEQHCLQVMQRVMSVEHKLGLGLRITYADMDDLAVNMKGFSNETLDEIESRFAAAGRICEYAPISTALFVASPQVQSARAENAVPPLHPIGLHFFTQHETEGKPMTEPVENVRKCYEMARIISKTEPLTSAELPESRLVLDTNGFFLSGASFQDGSGEAPNVFTSQWIKRVERLLEVWSCHVLSKAKQCGHCGREASDTCKLTTNKVASTSA